MVTLTPTSTNWKPWSCIEGEDTPNTQYLTHFRDNINALHPSCRADSPMETEEETRTVTWREEGGQREREGARRETRRDRERRGRPREERRERHRRERDQERERGVERRQRDRGDRAQKERHQGQRK